MRAILRSKEMIVKDVAMKRLEQIFHKPSHQTILGNMTSGMAWSAWVDMTARELSELNKQNYSQRALSVFVDEATKGYAKAYLNACAAMGGDDA